MPDQGRRLRRVYRVPLRAASAPPGRRTGSLVLATRCMKGKSCRGPISSDNPLAFRSATLFQLVRTSGRKREKSKRLFEILNRTEDYGDKYLSRFKQDEERTSKV